jgi:hypothetical protein
MKKLLFLTISLSSLLVLAGNTLSVWAGGLTATVTLQALHSSAPADGKSSVTFKVYAYQHGCAPPAYEIIGGSCNDGSAIGDYPVSGATVWVTVTGSGYTLGGTSSAANRPYITSGADGYAQFTLSSTSVGSDTVTADGGDNKPSTTVSFTAPVVAAPKTVPKATPAPAPAPTPAPTPPAAPTSGVKVDNQMVAATSTPTVQSGKALVLSGNTIPNGVVTLYIFSTLHQATVTADTQGNWSYAVTGLEPGSHHAEATVTDPTTKLTSARATLAKFTIQAPPAAVVATKAPAHTQLWVWLLVGVVGVGAAAAGFLWWSRRHRRHIDVAPPGPTDITAPPQPPVA